MKNRIRVAAAPGRKGLWAISVMALAGALQQPAYAQEQRFSFDMASQPLSSALLELGRHMRLSVAAPSEIVADRMAPALRGEFTSYDAFDRILAGSGLGFEFVQPDAVRISAGALASSHRRVSSRNVSRSAIGGR